MNAVEIEQAVTDLASQSFDPGEFPFAFLEAFGNKATTIKRLKSGSTNSSDVEGGVLQRNNIHIAVCGQGNVTSTLTRLRESAPTTKAKAKYILATDGIDFEAEDIAGGETVACAYRDFPDHFGFFLALAGISTVKQVRESAFDIRATARLNKLYVELLRTNPEWGTAERRYEMNHFMARLIFCFFAEDTDIFGGQDLFTSTIEQMSARDSSNTHEVVGALFLAMNTNTGERETLNIPRWADKFPYVNGGLFSEKIEVPIFTKIARSYLLHIGTLDWTKINPDIFGSMIQAVTDDEERGALGLHYTSVSNILKVLNPLFLDGLREQLSEAGDNTRKLLNLRKRISKIRVFDPACGSGNFLVIAYKEMRAIEAEINKRRNEENLRTGIPLTNFRGIELRNFAAEIARLALIIAEYQCDVLYRGQQEALREFLPLDEKNWITCGDALHIDWLSICPPTGTGVKIAADDLFETPLDQAEIDFENEGGETYICSNPPYVWANNQTRDQKQTMLSLQSHFGTKSRGLDYVSGWLYKYALYSRSANCDAAFVATNSITQGEQVHPLWSALIGDGCQIAFAVRSFKWSNLAKGNAGVSVVVVGLSRERIGNRRLYHSGECIETDNISPYLLAMENIWVRSSSEPLNGLRPLLYGNKAVCGGGLTMSASEANFILEADKRASPFIKYFVGSDEITSGKVRRCVWIDDDKLSAALSVKALAGRLERVKKSRAKSPKKQTRDFADQPHRFIERRRRDGDFVALPCVSSETRQFLTPVLLSGEFIVSNRCFAAYGVPLWYLSILSSRLHYCWCETTSGKLETRLNYSNTLTWNTYPIPSLTEKNRADLSRTAADILLAREAHFPDTIAALYDPEEMPENLREAHDHNDEVIERIYIGRRFKNDTERLEKLFELYTKMTAQDDNSSNVSKAGR